MEKPSWGIIKEFFKEELKDLNQFIKKVERKAQLETKNKDKIEKIGFVAIGITIIGFWIGMITLLGIFGVILSILITCILYYIISYHLKIISKKSADSEEVNQPVSSDSSDNKKAKWFTRRKAIKILILVLVLTLLYVDFHTYFVDPEITITSPISGEVVKIDEDNTFFKISGISKGLANNQFLHLFILYRRVDSNQESGGWNFCSGSCTVYNDGSWECRIQLKDLYKKWVNETLFVKSPVDSSENISTNVDIVAIITKQSITHSVLTKIKTRLFAVSNEVDGPDWYKTIIFLLPTGEGTYYDRDYHLHQIYDLYYDFLPDDFLPDWHYGLDYLPKHLADHHVAITPLIEPFNLTGSPHGLCVYADPYQIPADNVTAARVEVQILDSAGKRLHSEGRVLNLTSTRGNLSTTQIITYPFCSGVAYISSGDLGRGVISVQSPGLNNGTCQLEYTLPEVEVGFNQWVMSSQGDSERSELTANFQTMHAGEYSVFLTGWGTEAHRLFKPEEWPIVRVEVDEIILEDREVESGSSIEAPYGNVHLNAGNHTLKVNLTNYLDVPLAGERNFYVVGVEFRSMNQRSNPLSYTL